MMRLSLLFSSVLIGLTPLGAWAWNHQPGGDEEEPVKATVRVVEGHDGLAVPDRE